MNKELPRVFHFSGGASSALMVIRNYRPGDLVIFCDTGREHPKTYKFINDFEAHENIPVIRLQFTGGWKGFLQKWNKGRNIPNRFKRECTIQLKIKTARRYLRSIGLTTYMQFVGFRIDEQVRVKGYKEQWKAVVTKFPLNDEKIDTSIVQNYWRSKSYKLEMPKILGNCDLCFMKGADKIIAVLTNEPELADKWIDDEEANANGYTYLKEISFRQMKDKALELISQGKIYDLNELTPKYSCACTA